MSTTAQKLDTVFAPAGTNKPVTREEFNDLRKQFTDIGNDIVQRLAKLEQDTVSQAESNLIYRSCQSRLNSLEQIDRFRVKSDWIKQVNDRLQSIERRLDSKVEHTASDYVELRSPGSIQGTGQFVLRDDWNKPSAPNVTASDHKPAYAHIDLLKKTLDSPAVQEAIRANGYYFSFEELAKLFDLHPIAPQPLTPEQLFEWSEEADKQSSTGMFHTITWRKTRRAQYLTARINQHFLGRKVVE